jgi:hypothetical protein
MVPMNPATQKDLNRKLNQFRREAIKMGQQSPFRQRIYAKARMAGHSQEEALAESRGNIRGKQGY